MTSRQQDQQQQNQQRIKAAQEMTARQEGDRVGIKTQQSEVAERKFNPGFYQEIANADVDTDLFPWVSDELGPTLAKPHILGDRDPSYVEEQQLLNMNKAERLVAESSPGRLLKKNKEVLAVWQNVDGTDDVDFQAPIDKQQERRVYRDAMELATNRQSLAVNGRGIDALTKATTETTMRKDEEEEKRGIRQRLTGVTK